jgi:polar amino acid transport system permease protein
MDVIYNNFFYLLQAAGQTVILAVATIIVSTILGAILGVLMVIGGRFARSILVGLSFVVRGIPLLVLLFLIYFGLPALKIYMPNLWAAGIGLTFYFAFFSAEVVRGAILAVPNVQEQSAKALGLSRLKRMRFVILPQALRTAIPPLMNIWVILVKGTSYASIISVWELTLASKEVVETTLAPFAIFSVTMVLYFIICYSLTRVGDRVERSLKF